MVNNAFKVQRHEASLNASKNEEQPATRQINHQRHCKIEMNLFAFRLGGSNYFQSQRQQQP